MPIKLPIPEIKSRDDLRAEYIALHAKTTSALVKTLRELIDPHRVAYQRHIADGLIARVNAFIERRKPGQTVEDYYNEQDKGVSGLWRVWAAELLELLLKLTNYEQRLDAAKWDSTKGTYEPFQINLKPRADQTAIALAADQVEQTVQKFLFRAQDKLVDVMVAYPEYTAKLLNGGFHSGVFQGTISLRFERPDLSDDRFVVESCFVLKIGLKYNYSKLGTPYVQYPFTFHDYNKYRQSRRSKKLNDYSKPVPISEDRLQEEFNFEGWKPPEQQRPRFKTVSTGSVIITTGGSIRLVLRTKKVKGTDKQVAVTYEKFGAAFVQNETPEDQIVRSIAEIKNVWAGWKGPNGQPSTCTVYFVEGYERMDLGVPTRDTKDADVRIAAFQRLVAEQKLKS